MNLVTLKDARSLCAPVALAGSACAPAPLLDKRINEAVRRLARMTDLTEMVAVIHIVARGNTVTLPAGVKTARLINVGLNPVRLRHVGYEFSTSGPGQESEGECGPLSMVAEPGLYPTFFDLPCDRELVLAAFLPSRDPNATSLRVYGKKANGETILDDQGREGSPMMMSTWKGGLEGEIDANASFYKSVPLRQVDQLVLPTRKQYMTLLAYDSQTHETWFLGKYHPETHNPGFRRYRIRGTTCPEEHCVSLLVKLHPREVLYPEDPLPIQNLDAVKQMVMSIREENARNIQESLTMAAAARSALVSEMEDSHRGEEFTLQIRDDYGYSGGALSL